ncbi:MAG TPA: CPBP family intramembrane glutamic endopeptidase [Candidatus Angelobacter sp.]|jgi:hypothetical protein|nr:CPBP family intramembrane glutamic endopeptidase [Candidatus Angelobacter sp.]
MDSTGTQPARELTSEPDRPVAIENRQRWLELGLVIFIAIVPLTLRAISSLFYPSTGTRTSTNIGFVSGLVHQITSLCLVFYVLGRRGLSLRAIGFDSPRWMDVVKALGLAVLGLVLSAFISTLVRHTSPVLTGHAATVRDPRVIFAEASPLLMLVYIASSSLFEETVVRGYVTTEMIGLACPVWLATLASILLQTSYHVYYGLGGALAVSGTFIVLGRYFARYRRLLPVILGHLFVDLTAFWLNHFY